MRLYDRHHRELRSRDLNLDLEVLRSFLAVADHGNITAAAQAVGKAQSTISTHIQRMEAVYDCILFTRSKRGVTLSEHGATLRDVAERILQLHATAHAEITGAGLTGTLRVGTMDDFATDRLARVLARFAAQQPGIGLTVRTALSDELHAAIDTGELDVAVARRPHGETSGTLLAREPLCWVGNEAATDLMRQRPLPLVMFRPGCLYRGLVTDALDTAGRSWRVMCASGSLSGVTAAVAAGFGLTVLAESTVPPLLKRLSDGLGLPPLPITEVAICCRKGTPSELVDPLIAAIRQEQRRPEADGCPNTAFRSKPASDHRA